MPIKSIEFRFCHVHVFCFLLVSFWTHLVFNMIKRRTNHQELAAIAMSLHTRTAKPSLPSVSNENVNISLYSLSSFFFKCRLIFFTSSKRWIVCFVKSWNSFWACSHHCVIFLSLFIIMVSFNDSIEKMGTKITSISLESREQQKKPIDEHNLLVFRWEYEFDRAFILVQSTSHLICSVSSICMRFNNSIDRSIDRNIYYWQNGYLIFCRRINSV